MRGMFHSATLRLTIWYLLILMSVGIIFSVIIYQLASSEVSDQLEAIREQLRSESIVSEDFDFTTLQSLQRAREAHASIFTSLAYMNVMFLAVGGVASYLLARRTLEPIEQVHEAQSRFTSDASHELRTPLAAMKTELEVALRDPKLSKAEMLELLESNLEEVDKLSQISHTLLLLSRLDYGGLSTRRIAFDDIVRRLIENINRQEPRIDYTAPDKPLYITAHQVSIEELVIILLDNALKYSPKNSKIRVKLRKRGKKAQLQVVNTGKGINPDELPHIFERFYRADESRTGGGKTGFGLGLALAKRVVEVHHGDLSVRSGVGKETAFTVSLPLHESAKKPKLKNTTK